MVPPRATATFMLLGGIALLGCIGGPSEIEAPPLDARSVLFLGNSLTSTNNLPGMVERLLEAGTGEEVYVESIAPPNWGLQDHWAGRAREVIALGWDLVVMQQGPSATEGRPSLLDFSDAFADEIRGAGGTPALYMVWPALARFFDYDGVFDSYQTAAVNVDGYFFPSGEAWRVAWETDPDVALYGVDDFHPSALGTYVAALVMYEQISGLDARALPGGTAGFPIEDGVDELLRAAAHEANARHAREPGPTLTGVPGT